MSVLEQLPEDLKAAPEHFSLAAREFFGHVIATGSYDAPARAMLVRFCEIRDQLSKLRMELAKADCPFTFIDKHNQPRMNPLVKHELALTNEYGKLFRLLGWDQAPPDGGQANFFFMNGPRNSASH